MGAISGLSAIDTVESFNPRFPRDLGKQRRFPGLFLMDVDVIKMMKRIEMVSLFGGGIIMFMEDLLT